MAQDPWIPAEDDEEGYPEAIFLDAVQPEWICNLLGFNTHFSSTHCW